MILTSKRDKYSSTTCFSIKIPADGKYKLHTINMPSALYVKYNGSKVYNNHQPRELVIILQRDKKTISNYITKDGIDITYYLELDAKSSKYKVIPNSNITEFKENEMIDILVCLLDDYKIPDDFMVSEWTMILNKA